METSFFNEWARAREPHQSFFPKKSINPAITVSMGRTFANPPWSDGLSGSQHARQLALQGLAPAPTPSKTSPSLRGPRGVESRDSAQPDERVCLALSSKGRRETSFGPGYGSPPGGRSTCIYSTLRSARCSGFLVSRTRLNTHHPTSPNTSVSHEINSPCLLRAPLWNPGRRWKSTTGRMR